MHYSHYNFGPEAKTREGTFEALAWAWHPSDKTCPGLARIKEGLFLMAP